MITPEEGPRIVLIWKIYVSIVTVAFAVFARNEQENPIGEVSVVPPDALGYWRKKKSSILG